MNYLFKKNVIEVLYILAAFEQNFSVSDNLKPQRVWWIKFGVLTLYQSNIGFGPIK